jgi:hypothetical protein
MDTQEPAFDRSRLRQEIAYAFLKRKTLLTRIGNDFFGEKKTLDERMGMCHSGAGFFEDLENNFANSDIGNVACSFVDFTREFKMMNETLYNSRKIPDFFARTLIDIDAALTRYKEANPELHNVVDGNSAHVALKAERAGGGKPKHLSFYQVVSVVNTSPMNAAISEDLKEKMTPINQHSI